MAKQPIGILHPGKMGISIAASAQNSGCDVFWASEKRSSNTRRRAAEYNLRDAHSLGNLCKTCGIIVCVCPPHGAEEVADQVMEQNFKGLYVDANAIAPQRVVDIGQRVTDAGMSFVDGGIIGSPAWKPGTTWLYLAGVRAPIPRQKVWRRIQHVLGVVENDAPNSKGKRPGPRARARCGHSLEIGVSFSEGGCTNQEGA